MADQLEKPASVKIAVPLPDQDDFKSSEKPLMRAVKPGGKRSWKVWLLVGAVVFVVLTLILVNVAKLRFSGTTPDMVEPLLVTPTIVPRPTVPDFPFGEATVYSNDPQILQLEGAMKSFERQLENLDIRELDLDPPVLLMDVNFTLPRK
jgi:hypothetical protein